MVSPVLSTIGIEVGEGYMFFFHGSSIPKKRDQNRVEKPEDPTMSLSDPSIQEEPITFSAGLRRIRSSTWAPGSHHVPQWEPGKGCAVWFPTLLGVPGKSRGELDEATRSFWDSLCEGDGWDISVTGLCRGLDQSVTKPDTSRLGLP